MHRNRDVFTIAEADETRHDILSRAFTPTGTPDVPMTPAPNEWDWETEHEDRRRERTADDALKDALPFLVDRSGLRGVVKEKMGREVVRIVFLSSGTFHKAYLVTLSDKQELVARVARRFMPRLKTESEVATMAFIRENTSIPVPYVYHHDSNPYNRLGGEYILMSKAPGIPLAKVYYSMPHQQLVKLLQNLASIILPLFAHRFTLLGSLYSSQPSANGTNPVMTPKPDPGMGARSAIMTPKASSNLNGISRNASFGGNGPTSLTSSIHEVQQKQSTIENYHIGPIVSWPFFGSNRGDLSHPSEINRGPWPSSSAYFTACAEREISGVIRENEGKSAPHRLHLDPDEIRSSRHHGLKAVPGDASDESDEYDLEESEDEWEGPGDAMYRDYRRMQRTTFLIAHVREREERVRKEMKRWKTLMERLVKLTVPPASTSAAAFSKNSTSSAESDGKELFGIDCHDLSLENIFVDEKDHSSITCVIDWESTTTRPLWACAHLPAFLTSSPFAGKLFRQAVQRLATEASSRQNGHSKSALSSSAAAAALDLPAICREWLYYEAAGVRLRMAHRFVEWDGWEEGLVDTILGSEEQQEGEWFVDIPGPGATTNGIGAASITNNNQQHKVNGTGIILHETTSPPLASSRAPHGSPGTVNVGAGIPGTQPCQNLKPSLSRQTTADLVRKQPLPSSLAFAKEKEKEQMLMTTGDICGGRGGELGRRLEAWLIDSENQGRGGIQEEGEEDHLVRV